MDNNDERNRVIDQFMARLDRERPIRGLCLETEAELRAAFAVGALVTRISPRIGSMFAADPMATLETFGISLSDELGRRFRIAVMRRGVDAKRFAALMSGRTPASGARNYISLSTQEQRQLARAIHAHPRTPDDDGHRATLTQLYALLPLIQRIAPARGSVKPNNRQQNVSSTSAPGARLFALPPNISFNTTGGHDIMVQIEAPIWAELISQALLLWWIMWGLVASLGGDVPDDVFTSVYRLSGRLLCFDFRVTFEFDGQQLPNVGFSQERVDEAVVTFPCQIEVEVRGDANEEWKRALGQRGRLVNRSAVLKRDDSVEFLGSKLSNLFIADLASGEFSVELDNGELDPLTELLILMAAHDMCSTRFPLVPVSPPLGDVRPFMFFEDADWSTLRSPAVALGGGIDAFTLTWGPSSEPFALPMITDGHNLCVGISRAVLSFYAERDLPDVPLISDGVTLEVINIEPRMGFIEVWGSGRVSTCDCWPDETFNYSLRIGLELSAAGELSSTVLASVVDVNGVSSFLLEALGGLGGSTIVWIAESLFGQELASEVGDRLDVNLNLLEMLSMGDGLELLDVAVDTVRVTPNGLFLDGVLSVAI